MDLRPPGIVACAGNSCTRRSTRPEEMSCASPLLSNLSLVHRDDMISRGAGAGDVGRRLIASSPLLFGAPGFLKIAPAKKEQDEPNRRKAAFLFFPVARPGAPMPASRAHALRQRRNARAMSPGAFVSAQGAAVPSLFGLSGREPGWLGWCPSPVGAASLAALLALADWLGGASARSGGAPRQQGQHGRRPLRPGSWRRSGSRGQQFAPSASPRGVRARSAHRPRRPGGGSGSRGVKRLGVEALGRPAAVMPSRATAPGRPGPRRARRSCTRRRSP
jgi:hypothetical protein